MSWFGSLEGAKWLLILGLLCFIISPVWMPCEITSLKIDLQQPQLAFESLRMPITGLTRACVIGPQASDWSALVQMINDEKPFAFVRLGDGERMLASGEAIGRVSQAYVEDKYWHEGGDSQIGRDLRASLKGHFGQEYYYGLPSPHEDTKGLKWFLLNTEQDCGHISYANIWVNSFYPATRQLLNGLLSTSPSKLVIVANYESLQNLSNVNGIQYTLALPDDAPHVWNGKQRNDLLKAAEALAKALENHLFCVSGGPMAKILISHMWNVNPRNQYVDFGSSMDELLKKRKTRPYMTPDTIYAKRIDPTWFLSSVGEIKII